MAGSRAELGWIWEERWERRAGPGSSGLVGMQPMHTIMDDAG